MRLGPLRSTGRLPDGPLKDKKAEDGAGGLHAVQTAKKTRTIAEWSALGRLPTPTFRLLDLPEDIIDLILQFVALHRYSYSESRRPRPSPLEILSLSKSPILRWRCQALLYHRGSSEPDPTKASPSQIQTYNRFRRLHYLRFIQTALETVKDIAIPPNARFVELSTQVMTYPEIGGSGASASRSRNWTFPVGYSLLITSNLTELRLRHLQFDMWLLPVSPSQSMRIRRLDLVDVWDEVAQFLLEQCKALTELKLTLWNVKSPIAQWVCVWDRLEVFELECRPLQKSPSATTFTRLPLETALQSLIIPSDAALRSLSVTIFLSSQSRPSRTVSERLCAALECFSRAGPKIRHLSLDEFTLLKPQDVEWLAEKLRM
ncbi:hypothetical protein MVLG_03619 [Microbotryum lychnidis-dioicae p1A1 Lamole]|uniref:Uncharacterized protein n=1 Tax=Microbotryum lychnidis-dioicae (strain p1A1 Lamole / MvSl-1064) TaxID=683840 RepID=U5H8R8_USTV1|nr:hypothetical protein MVLG_03619 [Microbotryum lychnidis-dioicae p1A1 Lamole]|eukprot:KDE06067.1 hypothetical protein MVLG_03619 [Microbotryum lychnidis-dioicae p1A1 Lamole]